jgi:2-C-methyl-D-erythritol 4-phosphate cytidylyltransferase/2-C-methyl-D-erythritol 2,4-cyclodiphosphate synthase
MQAMTVGVVIVAAGRGERFGGDRPKQMLDLGGRPLLQHSVQVFDRHPRVSEVVVVLPADWLGRAAEIVGPSTRPIRAVAGGRRRQDSVRAGVDALSRDVDVVLVHDAARPFVDGELIARVLGGVAEAGAAVPAVPARDTVKRRDGASGHVVSTLSRDEIWLAQTPQGFRREVLAAAFAGQEGGADATDDAMLVERTGRPVAIVPGDERNVKITTPDDLGAARARVTAASRVGTGYDLHRLVEGRPLVLAGVVVPSDRGPLGHSDGDVVCHAIVDAMLGAAALGDIGRHFPDTDPRWKGAPGLDLLSRAAAIIGDAGWRVASLDATVLLERPKVGPHVDDIRRQLAAALKIDVGHIGLKAKTNEGVDAVGRGEAVAAHAVAVLVPGWRS